jgi:hypothetical protein
MRPSLFVYHTYAPLDSYDSVRLPIYTLRPRVVRKICRSPTYSCIDVCRLKQIQLVCTRSERVTKLWILNIGSIHAVDGAIFG